MPVRQARAPGKGSRQGPASADPDPLHARLGLSVPHGWWPSAPLLKSYEAAGFGWVQLHSPPATVLAQPRQLTRHAAAAAASLDTTSLQVVLHAPGTLRAGSRAGDRAFEGLLSYAAEIGAAQVVYHALALPETAGTETALAAEVESLTRLAGVAERLEVTVAIENLAPLFPAPETLSASPLALRDLARRIGSDRVCLCLDLGHAHVIADLRHTSVERLCEPVLDLVGVFHVHDNFGARRRPTGEELGVDPLRLDLHLPPGRGTLPWDRLATRIVGHEAPIVLEVHPPHRPRAGELARETRELLTRLRR